MLYFHAKPTRVGAPTFIFVNALTGSTDAWEAVVAPRLREQGFGTLSWNFRGQTGSPFAPATALTDQLIVGDLLRLLRETAPRIAWVNDALPAIVAYGGVGLFMDALLPLLVNPEYAAKVRGERLKGGHAPLDPTHGHMNLMRNSVATDWKLPWSALQLPTLVVTGLCDRRSALKNWRRAWPALVTRWRHENRRARRWSRVA